MNLAQIKAAHPMPWRHSMLGNQVLIYDANDVEVPLFTLVDLVVMVTAGLAKSGVPVGV